MLCYTRKGTTITKGMIRYNCLMSMNKDQIIFMICSAPSTMSILLVIDGSETVRSFGTREKALWNVMLHNEWYNNYQRLGTVQVLDVDEYGPNFIFAICLSPSTMSMLLVIDGLETMRCFGTCEKALWNVMLYKEWYNNYPRHGTVQVLDVNEYGSNYICDMFGSFYNVYIIGN